MSREPNDLTGKKFGRLTALALAGKIGKRVVWRCKCECSEVAIVRSEHLVGGRVKSCGCIRRELAEKLKFIHGHARSNSLSFEFLAWCSAKDRCYNQNNGKYYSYGGRGIKMAKEWRNDYLAFFNHIGPKPSPKHSLDRIDNDGDYEPGNVRWATAHEQRMNQRRMKTSPQIAKNPPSC